MSIRAVFFDLDDTLCDTIGSRPGRTRRALEWLCAEYADLDLDRLIARAMEPVDERIVRGVPRLLDELGLRETKAGREATGIWFFAGCYDLLKTVPDAVEVLERLRETYVLGVITNGDGELQRGKLKHLGLALPHVVISGEFGCEKPDPRIFHHALSLCGVRPQEAVFVGDRLDVDVAGAKGAGMRAVWFNHWGGSLDGSVRPDAAIERFQELPEVLELLGQR